MVEALRKHTFSASSINTYLRNPFEFYERYVLGLREEDDLLDEPEAKDVGTFVHGLLEHAFRPFIGKEPKIDKNFRHHFFEEFEKRFEERFGRTMKSDSFLLKSVIVERLKRFLDFEERAPQRRVKKILHLEQRFENTIDLSCGKIKFGYIVDRIDLMEDGTVMIVDYKTGAVDQIPKAFERLDTMTLSRESLRDQLKSFQIPLYFHYLSREFKGQSINAALYNLRTLEVHKFLDEKTQVSAQDIDRIFLKNLDFILSEILDPAVDFVEDRSLIRV